MTSPTIYVHLDSEPETRAKVADLHTCGAWYTTITVGNMTLFMTFDQARKLEEDLFEQRSKEPRVTQA